jgi:hypothetical protein
MSDSTVTRYPKGKRPGFYADPAMDEAMSMIMVLSSELFVLRERLDTFEALAAEKGLMLGEEIDSFEPDQELAEKREARKQEFFDRLFYVANKRAAELATQDTSERYESVLKTIAEE